MFNQNHLILLSFCKRGGGVGVGGWGFNLGDTKGDDIILAEHCFVLSNLTSIHFFK